MGTRRHRLSKLARCRAPALIALVAAASAAALGCRPGASPRLEWNDEVATEIEAWREKHEADYRRDWATIEGLHFLVPGTQSAGSAPDNDVVLTAALPPRVGRFTVARDEVTFDPEPGVALTINGQTPSSVAKLRDDDGDETDEIVANGVSIVVHRTGERLALRVRDPHGERARAFRGFSWFPISRDYRVVGRFIADSVAHDERVVNTFGDIDTYKTEGVVEFALNGQTLRLRPFTTGPKRFYIVFNDASSGEETYEAARFLIALLRDDGTTILDFNEAYNPPCAFNPFTTCPIPMPQNRLRVRVLAGEKKYAGHVEPPVSTPR
ncbi:MAG TPA: DUF1684 domain-containing protein [Gammaproteobacteria bacterium]|nr:DUF1684 domain-containing protein [Gammaproteobacteria bacterium]